MLTKEECLQAVRVLALRNETGEGLVALYPYFKYEFDCLFALIHEHFENPPLKFEELEEGMWVWDNYWEEYFEISEVYSNTKEIDVLIHQNKINQRRYETIKYTPNRFYRKEVK